MKKSKLVIFDFDGVIVNTFPFAYEINREQFGITEDEYRKKFEGNFYKAPVSTIAKKTASANFDFFESYTPHLMIKDPEEGIVESIEKLSEEYTLVIVSSTLTKIINDYLEKNGIRNYFQEILGSDFEKSKVIKINHLLNKYDIQPSEAVFITDTSGDVEEARQCHVHAVAVTWGYHPKVTLEQANPLYIIDTPVNLEVAIKNYFFI